MISKRKIKIHPIGGGNSTDFGELNYKNGLGYFGLINKTPILSRNLGLVTCREEIAVDWEDKRSNLFYCKRMLFSVPNLNIKLLNKFFNQLENKLKLKQKSVFYFTNRADTVIVGIAPFWTTGVVRKSLFTLFLRCGAVYYKDNFNQALKSYNLTRRCLPAINYFLKGNIISKKSFWCYHSDYGYSDYENTFNGFSDFFTGYRKSNKTFATLKKYLGKKA